MNQRIRRCAAHAASLACLIVFATAVSAQQGDPARAQAQLDAARAQITPDQRNALQRYTQLVALEVRAGREQNARELTHLVQGLILEKPEDQRDDSLHLLAQCHLDQGQTEDALRVLEQIDAPGIMARGVYLQAVHQATARFGLQRGIDLARAAFPEVMERRDVYCKLCYTLAINDQPDLALEFIDVAMDLTEIFQKLDAYRFTAVGMYKRGDQAGAAGVLDQARQLASRYGVATTRVSMLTDLAATYAEIGVPEETLPTLALAEEAFAEIEEDNYQRDGAVQEIALAWARLGNHDRAVAWLAVATNDFGHDAVYKTIARNHLAAGEVGRARAISDEHDVLMFGKFDDAAALTALERGEAEPALSHVRERARVGFNTGDLVHAAARALAQHAHHAPLQQLIAAIEDPDTRYHAHRGAADGYLPDDTPQP